jgi:hypothetical protein
LRCFKFTIVRTPTNNATKRINAINSHSKDNMSLLTRTNVLNSQYFFENDLSNSYHETRITSQVEDDLAVNVLMNMVHMSDIPDVQRVALACLQTRLRLLAQKQDSLHKPSSGRLMNLIAPEEKLVRSISITDLDCILGLSSPQAGNKRNYVTFADRSHEDDDVRSRSSSFDAVSDASFIHNNERGNRRRNHGVVYEFLTPGSQVRILKTGQEGVVVGEKNGGWRIIEFINAKGDKVYGTYRPSDMTPAE